MLAAFAVLLLFQCLGEGVVFVLRLPLPAPWLACCCSWLP